MSSARTPAVAGQFYAGTADGLREQVQACFTHEIGPGEVPDGVMSGPRRLAGAVVPHAGLPFSGPIAAHSYATLAADGSPDTAIIIGPNHRGPGVPVAVAPHEAWATPLGELPVDASLREAVVETTVAEASGRPHAGEHSAEIQLPFLQYLYEETVSVLPIALSRQDKRTCWDLGEGLQTAIEATDRDAVILASTDLTHYQSHQEARAADQPVIEAIADQDAEAVAEHVNQGHSMCGPGAMYALLGALAAGNQSHTGTIQAAATSGDTAGAMDRVVGYCAVTFAREP